MYFSSQFKVVLNCGIITKHCRNKTVKKLNIKCVFPHVKESVRLCSNPDIQFEHWYCSKGSPDTGTACNLSRKIAKIAKADELLNK